MGSSDAALRRDPSGAPGLGALDPVTGYLIALTGDALSQALVTIGHAHQEQHAGNAFFVRYSVADLGAMTTPDDMITLTFTTPNTSDRIHFTFTALGTSGWRVRFIEGPSGGATSPTGSLTVTNHERNSLTTSVVKDVAGSPAANKVSYDASLATGGTTLWDDYITGATIGIAGNGVSAQRDELILKANTTYQLSLYGTDNTAGTLYMNWYEE